MQRLILSSRHRATSLLAACLLVGMVAANAKQVVAGVTAENVIVVVNADSQVSRTVANHYTVGRGIPPGNVIFLEDVPTDTLKIDLATFKSKVLLPVLQQLNARGLAPQARVIAYSADFPTSVDISPHTAKLTNPDQRKYQQPTASITGLTFFYRFVLADSPSYLGWASNLYARGDFPRHFANPFTGPPGEAFAEAEKHLAEDRPGEAAAGFAKLFTDHPSLCPLAIRTAEAYAKAGDLDVAKEWIKKAIEARWWSATYLRQSKTLGPLLDSQELEPLVEQLSDAPTVSQQPLGFSATVGWTLSGHPIANPRAGVPYLLSCMLAVVHPRGSTVDQAVAVFERSASADHQFPEGDFWFSSTSNVRTKTRRPAVDAALQWLEHIGREAEIIEAVMPDKSGACAGLMLGTAKMTLPGKDWHFVPGALSENLTSFSGHFGNAAQTKMTELLHAGVAMTSGPVAEPYSIPHKFPTPMMYAFYASGATTIEAFYLSITSPYQLLVVGDPICQPFARPPQERVSIELQLADSEPPNPAEKQDDSKSQDESGMPAQAGRQEIHVRLQQREATLDQRPPNASAIELFIDGRLVQQASPAQDIVLRLPADSSGRIEVRAVLVGHDPTEPRIGFVETIQLGGPRASPTLTRLKPDSGERAPKLKLSVQAADADAITVVHDGQPLARLESDRGTLIIDAQEVGNGPIRLRAFAQFGDAKVPGEVVSFDQP